MPPLPIAILECDTIATRSPSPHGTGYTGLFTRLLHHGAAKYPSPPNNEPVTLTITTHNARECDFPAIENTPLQGIIISGSRSNAFDNEAWIVKLVAFVRGVLDAQRKGTTRVRLIGVCFGHQVIARALGWVVARGEGGWEVSVSRVELTERGGEVFGEGERVLHIHQFHRDVVHAPTAMNDSTSHSPTSILDTPFPAREVHILGSSPKCAVQGIYSPNSFLTVQGHPEFTGELVADLLDTRHKDGILEKSVYEDAKKRVMLRHDGDRVAAGFVRFLVKERRGLTWSPDVA